MTNQAQTDRDFFRMKHAAILLLILGQVFCIMGNVRLCCADDFTDLMFVGEELEVITIASGREEGAWKAPVIADVISAAEIESRGASNLMDLLETEPGFCVFPAETGYNVYLRGIQDSVLFLNDSVPAGTRLNKNYNSINPYLSLSSVKRIEIVRGPGSVLWGADAFAGIVNVVPLTGKDFDGLEAGVNAGTTDAEKGAYLKWGENKGQWDSFVNIAAGTAKKDAGAQYNFVHFWKNQSSTGPVDPQLRYGDGDVERPKYLEMTANTGFEKKIRLSSNLSFYNIPFTRSLAQETDLVWKEENQAFSGFIKVEGSYNYNIRSGFRYTGYISWYDTRSQIVDLTLDDQERVFFGELIHENSVLNGNGLITVGISGREQSVNDLSVWDNYYPYYFSDDNLSFLPWTETYSYSLSTLSVFSQYQHTFKHADIWVGVRGDEHEASKGKLSYSIGFALNPIAEIGFKAAYGNAYKTPVAIQIQEDKTRMENIETLSMQAEWKPNSKCKLDITGYVSRLKDGYMQNPAIGLSETVNDDFYGAECQFQYSLFQDIDITANLAWVKNKGDERLFRYNDYSYFEDGQIKDHYIDMYYPADIGAELTFNAGFSYKINRKARFRAQARYMSQRTKKYLLDDSTHVYPDVWVFDAGLNIKDLFGQSMDTGISISNLFNRKYVQPGDYGAVEGQGFAIEVRLKKSF